MVNNIFSIERLCCMKYTFLGLNQKIAVDLELKMDDMAIVKKITEIFSYSNTKTEIHNDEVYFWVKIDAIIEDYPILGLKKRTIINRIRKMASKGIFKKISRTTPYGNFSYYRGTPLLDSLLDISHKKEKIHRHENSSGNKIHRYNGSTGNYNGSTGSYENSSISSSIEHPIKSTSSSKKTIPNNQFSDIQISLPIKVQKNEEEEEDKYEFLKYIFKKDREEIGKHSVSYLKYYFEKCQKKEITDEVKNFKGLYFKYLINDEDEFYTIEQEVIEIKENKIKNIQSLKLKKAKEDKARKIQEEIKEKKLNKIESEFKKISSKNQKKWIENVKESNPFLTSNKDILFSMAAQKYYEDQVLLA